MRKARRRRKLNFFVSLEDDFRIFGSDSMNNILKLGLKDGESIDHPWINKALERVCKKGG